MSFWDKVAREMQGQRQARTQPEPEAEEVFLDMGDPTQARYPVVGSEVITVSAGHRSWEHNSRKVQRGNEFDLSPKARAQLHRDLTAGRFNKDGTDVTAAHANAAVIQEYIRHGAFDSANNQRMPQRF